MIWPTCGEGSEDPTSSLCRRFTASEPILASAALPGVYPPVEIDGRLLIDGGIANNTPITTAINAGATEV
jgi:predicted acylesterase/phospholipase RssA